MIGVFGAELDLYLQETFGFLALTDESRVPLHSGAQLGSNGDSRRAGTRGGLRLTLSRNSRWLETRGEPPRKPQWAPQPQCGRCTVLGQALGWEKWSRPPQDFVTISTT